VISFVVVLIAVIAASSIVLGRQARLGPPQPVPFSHRVHAGTKQLSCFFCHNSALSSGNAGLPPVEKCVLCHKVIASQWRPLRDVLSSYDKKKPIRWVRVNRLPDFVHFSHQAHLTNTTDWGKRFDCSACHGNIKAMDRVRTVHQFNMKFCVDCHWKNNFSVSCYTCHW
jgi:hypothetical protein